MKTINLTDDQAATLADGGPDADTLARTLRTEAQTLANESGETVEIYHPEGWVWDARMAK